jgi:hypothetical protein
LTRLGRNEIAFVLGVPVAWAIVLLFHPVGDGDRFYPIVRDEVTRWELVHLATMLFIPLMAVVVYLIVRGVEGTAAKVTRVALPVFVVFYGAFEVLIGVGMGVLVNEVNGLSQSDLATGDALVQGYGDSSLIEVVEVIGSAAWLVALLSAGLALFRHADAPVSVPVLLALAAIPIAFHVPPFGQVGLGLFVLALVLLIRAQSHRPAPAVRAVPGPA